MLTASTSALSRNAAYHHILRTDGGERIFRAFNLDIGARAVSPFRADARNKNFSVFCDKSGTVLFKDFVSGAGGSFTALLHGFGYHTFEAQIRFAATFYGISLRNEGKGTERYAERDKEQSLQHIVPPRPRPVQTTNTRTSQKKYRVTALHADVFNADECAVLHDLSNGAITSELLDRFGLRALRSYTDEGRTHNGTPFGGTHAARYTLVAPAADGNFYAYCYFKADIASPFPNHAKNFHLKLHDYHSEVKFALGLNELRPNEAAYLVEGIKDCLILLAHGYNAFTLGGVQHRLLPPVKQHLTNNNNRLVICFDTDYAGINAAQKLAASLSELNPFVCTLPRLERQPTPDAPKPQHNDLADYVRLFGFDATLRTALTLPAPLSRTSLTQSGGYAVPAWQLSVKDKLMNDPAALKAISGLLEHASRLVLRAPTGCGKTYTVLRHIAPQHFERTGGGLTVLAVPTVALAEQARQEYADLKPIVITGSDNDAHRLYANDGKPDTCCVITTYDSASRIIALLAEPTTLLVIDEMHKLVQDYDYRSPAMRNMMCLLKQAHRVLCMSATPELLFHEAPLNFTFCDVVVEEQRPLFYTTLPYSTKRDEALLHHILSALQQQHDTPDLLFCQINSKTLLRRTKKLLVKYGIPDHDIDILHADILDTSPEYKHLCTTSRFQRKIILATKLLDTGINVLNTGRIQVVFLDERNQDTIIQTANRFRTAEDIHVVLLQKETQQKNKGNGRKENKITVPHNQQSLFTQTQMMAAMTADAFNTSRGSNTTAECGLGKRSHSRLFDRQLFFDFHTHQWMTDEAALLQRLHTLRLWCTTNEELERALAEYGFHKRDTDQQASSSTMLHPDLLNEIRVEEAMLREQQEITFFDLLEHHTLPFLAALTTLSQGVISLKDALTRFHPEALTRAMQQHPDTLGIQADHADLLREQRTHTLVRYYTEARSLGFDFREALHLVRTNADPRKWQSFTQRLAMKQREALAQAGLAEELLSKHDRTKLQREEEIRRFVANTALQGCTLTKHDGTNEYIPNSIRSKKDLAARVNAYQTTLYRLTQQSAGELVDAMFHVRYIRERVRNDDGKVVQSGTYRFVATEDGLKRKTLAEFVSEYGVDGADYTERFRARTKEEAERLRQHRMERQQTEIAVW